jgi:hypothetical protein
MSCVEISAGKQLTVRFLAQVQPNNQTFKRNKNADQDRDYQDSRIPQAHGCGTSWIVFIEYAKSALKVQPVVRKLTFPVQQGKGQ